MKELIIVSMCLIFAAGAIVPGNVFAQRSMNAAQDAAKAAKASLASQSHSSSSQIKWVDQLIDVINMDETAPKGTSTRTNKSDTAE